MLERSVVERHLRFVFRVERQRFENFARAAKSYAFIGIFSQTCECLLICGGKYVVVARVFKLQIFVLSVDYSFFWWVIIIFVFGLAVAINLCKVNSRRIYATEQRKFFLLYCNASRINVIKKNEGFVEVFFFVESIMSPLKMEAFISKIW